MGRDPQEGSIESDNFIPGGCLIWGRGPILIIRSYKIEDKFWREMGPPKFIRYSRRPTNFPEMSFRNRKLRSGIIVIEMQHFRETGSGILIVLSKHETLLKTGCSIPEKQASDNYVTINIKYIKRGFRFSGNVLP